MFVVRTFTGVTRKYERGITNPVALQGLQGARGVRNATYTGQQYPSSVQDLIGNPILEFFEGREHAFHGMGREDIDVRCLGRGRPFVLEVKEPKRWDIDYETAMKTINEQAEGRSKLQMFDAQTEVKSFA